MTTHPKPAVRPALPFFSSGPTTKRPGWSPAILNDAVLGRSHRSKPAKSKITQTMDLARRILGVPDDYLIGITPGSDTGAVEIALWSLLGARGVDVLAWESFGKDWVNDIVNQLQVDNVKVHQAAYGALPDLAAVNFDNDVVLTWNGTTSGVKVPNGDWIADDRAGLVIADATSACFAMELPWSKLDVVTFSFQKAIGGEGAHGVMVISPRAVERLNSYTPPWPIPKLFQLKKNNEINLDIFSGSTINTPSMICVEDFLDVLNWTKKIGGLEELIKRSKDNLNIIKDWVFLSSWVDFLCEDLNNLSNTSICLKLIDPKLIKQSLETKNIIEKNIIKLLEENYVAFDIGSYRSAPPGLRIWGGPTVDNDDIKKLLPWLDWAYHKSLRNIDI